MEFLNSIPSLYLRTLTALIVTMVAAIIYYKNRKAIDLWRLDRRYNGFFPKTKRLAKNDSTTGVALEGEFPGTDPRARWFHSEAQVCQDFKPHYKRISKDENFYNDCKHYLNLVGEGGRRPLSALMTFGLLVILGLEAWGFSYTMAQYLDLSASENTRVVMAYLIAIMFAVCLAFMTHLMGHEIHKNKLIGKVRANWQASTGEAKKSVLTQQIGEKVGTIQEASDLNEPPYQRMLNRLNVSKAYKSWTVATATIILIVVIAIGLTFVRLKTLELAQSVDSNCGSSVQITDGLPSYGNGDLDALYADEGSTDTGMPLPKEVAYDNAAKNQKVDNEICQATAQGSWATFGLMAIFFLILQAFATWVSIAFGFAGKESRLAYDATHKFKTVAEFNTHHTNLAREIADRAQRTLTSLQTRMAEVLPQVANSDEVQRLIATSSARTFYEFINQDDRKEIKNALATEQNQVSISQPKPVAPAPIVNEALSTVEPTSVVESAPVSQALTDEELKAQLLAEMQAEQSQFEETEEERKKRLLAELVAEGKLSSQP
ncbi:hypothetical protein ACWU4D_02260 [Vibrio sp. WJH972]